MADTSPLAGLLDRAGHVFSLAYQLGRDFENEHPRRRERPFAENTGWESRVSAFNEFAAAVLELRDLMQNPPAGFAPVAKALLEAATVAKQIRDSMKNPNSAMFAAYLDFWPHLNSVAASGRHAIKEVNKARRSEDPFAFLNQSTKSEDSIDTTPCNLPKPPQQHIEAAARDIPRILANVAPNHDGVIELPADHLAKQLQDAKHTLAAAHWAIHKTVDAGRLRTGRVEVYTPEMLVPGGPRSGSRLQPIPKGKPAPFDCFKVIATDCLWHWWRELDAEVPTKTPADGSGFIERLLAGPDDVELNSREMALLNAHLQQPIDIEVIDREQRETGSSQYQGNRNKLKLIRDFNRRRQEQHDPSSDADDQSEVKSAKAPVPTKKVKRSTQRDEGRTKLTAALIAHHQYDNGSCQNLEPIGNNELARKAEVSTSTASDFFEKQFGGHDRYQSLCRRNTGGLITALKLLNREYSPHELFGSRPADEDDRDDES